MLLLSLLLVPSAFEMKEYDLICIAVVAVAAVGGGVDAGIRGYAVPAGSCVHLHGRLGLRHGAVLLHHHPHHYRLWRLRDGYVDVVVVLLCLLLWVFVVVVAAAALMMMALMVMVIMMVIVVIGWVVGWVVGFFLSHLLSFCLSLFLYFSLSFSCLSFFLSFFLSSFFLSFFFACSTCGRRLSFFLCLFCLWLMIR